MTMAVGACGTGTGTGATHAPTAAVDTVINQDLDGLFTVSALIVSGDSVPVEGIQFDIDTEFATLRIHGPCSTLLGSFSLLADGRAGVTIAGGASSDCDRGDAEVQTKLVDVLGRVDSWARDKSGMVLTGSDGDGVELGR